MALHVQRNKLSLFFGKPEGALHSVEVIS